MILLKRNLKNQSKYLLGHSVSEDTKSKISKARLGMKFSNDTKRKQSIAHQGLKQYLYYLSLYKLIVKFSGTPIKDRIDHNN